MKVYCLQCQKEFKEKPSRVALGRGKYCSKKCKIESAKNKICCTCKECNKIFYVVPSQINHGRGIYCSVKCKSINLSTLRNTSCNYCNKNFLAKGKLLDNGGSKYCSKTCASLASRGKNSLSWKGGKYTNCKGYINIYQEKTLSYKFEHVLVIEKFLKRKLNSNEIVHHINGIKNDNRLTNLIVMTRSEHLSLHHKQGDIRKK